MSGRLSGSRVIVTGASRGIGRAIAEAAAAEGARLVVTATRADHLASVTARLTEAGAEVHPVALDLGDKASVDAAADAALAALGRIDALVNNAGMLGARAPLAEYPLDLWERVLAVDLTGVLALIQRIVPEMPPGGVILNLSSGAAGRAGWGAYGVAKLALDGAGEILAQELAERELRVVSLNPGGTRTAMRAQAYPDEDPATLPHPSSRAAAVIDLLAGDDRRTRVDLTGAP